MGFATMVGEFAKQLEVWLCLLPPKGGKDAGRCWGSLVRGHHTQQPGMICQPNTPALSHLAQCMLRWVHPNKKEPPLRSVDLDATGFFAGARKPFGESILIPLQLYMNLLGILRTPRKSLTSMYIVKKPFPRATAWQFLTNTSLPEGLSR